MASRSFEIWKERRASRMRQGQAVCEIVALLSDPETRIALVPVTDAEYENALELAMNVEAANNEHGTVLRDRIQQRAIILAAARETSDLTQRFFDSYTEVAEIENHDVNHIWDHYSEMVANSSPSIDGMSEEEFEAVKKALETMRWSELSGPQWYALKRFLISVTPRPLVVRSPGFSSTSSSTETKNEPTSALDAPGS